MRAVCRDAGARAGRDRRQLLRAWRRQHHVDPAGEPGAPAGLAITPRAVFQHQTVATLAAVAVAAERAAVTAVPDIATGALPATPIMHWLAERGGPIDRFSQAMLLTVPAGLGTSRSAAALQSVLDHHDALRLRLGDAGGNGWRGIRDAHGAAPAPCLRTRRSVRWQLDVVPRARCRRGPACAGSISRARRRGAAGRASPRRRRRQPDGLRRPTARCCRRCGSMPVRAASGPAAAGDPSPGGRRGVVAHPAARPGSRLPRPRCAGKSAPRCRRGHLVPALGADACGATRRIRTARRTAALDRACGRAPSLSLSDGALDRGRDLTGTRPRTDADAAARGDGPLLTRVAAAFHAGVNDVLLTALALAVMDWCRRHGRGARRQAVLVDVEGHGREEAWRSCCRPRPVAHGGLVHQPVPGAARSRALDAGDSISTMRWRAGAAIGRALKAIKEQLRALPDNGLGYGLLRYLNPQTAATAGGAAVAADRLQLSGPASRRPAPRTGRARPRPCRWRRRSGAGVGACGRDQRADARRRRRPEPGADLDAGRRR